MNQKKKALVFFAELRALYDISWEDWTSGKIYEKFDKFHQKIFEILEKECADVIIFSVIGNAGLNEEVNDFNYGSHKRSAWGISCVLDDYYDQESQTIVVRENGVFGKSLFKDGYAELSKKKGFGQWEMIEHKDDTPLNQKALSYLDELSESYDIEKTFIIDDEFGIWSTPALDASELASHLEKPVVLLIPCPPFQNYSSSNPSFINVDESCRISSSKTTVSGATECLDIYLKALSLHNKPRVKK